ncbi:PEP-CTERM sorting domain-containing protein [Massilia atriviolacea]|uniref:PEP-CTERM sorting domain-containing protein n=1 Tax=Massilia atriviolacea TaxID=2495579 RepID=A0A430HJ84_9BURK|nr:MHFG family PEP-CTERM protein [Massilia atriviolacea]RSZ57578.1 PEP-CTERM sorting domain-containing protein [Massilia atriviolacea]
MKRASCITVASSRVAGPLSACVLVLGAALMLAANPAHAAAASRVDKCDWDRPGVNPFMGDVVAAVDRYRDIPPLVRARLKERMADRNFDEFVTIGRDSIKGQNYYEPKIRDMHFGAGTVCGSVSRAGWSASTKQAGLVYCEGDHCILVPTVCRNVSRIHRIGTSGPSRGRAGLGGPGSSTSLSDEPAAPETDLALALRGTSAETKSVVMERTPAAPPGLTGYQGGMPVTPIGSGGFGPPFRDGPITGIDLTPVPETNLPAVPVPEPEQWMMMGLGLMAVMSAARRRLRPR